MMMERFKWHVGDKVTFHTASLSSGLDVILAGTLSGPNSPPTIVIVPIERLNQMMGNLGRAMLFFIRIDRSEFANSVIRAIDGRFANSAYGTTTETDWGWRNNACSNSAFCSSACSSSRWSSRL